MRNCTYRRKDAIPVSLSGVLRLAKQDHAKVEWFRRGAVALETVTGLKTGAYLCPLCLQPYSARRLDELTRDHVPPASLGGRRLVLTCKGCNSRAGHVLDDEMRSQEDIIELAKGQTRKPLKASVEVDGVKLRTRVRSGDGIMSLETHPRANPPGREALFKKAMSGLSSGGTFNVELDSFKSGRAQAGWLRSAYLVAFAALGYRYILSEPLIEVLEQISQPDRKVISNYLLRPDLSSFGNRIGFVTAPIELVCLWVQMGGHCIFLPLPDRPGLYQRISEFPDKKLVRLIVQGRQWPMEPMHYFDAPLEELDPLGRLRQEIVLKPNRRSYLAEPPPK